MCKCTPNMRTPWCGKPGCEMPEQHKPTIAENRRHEIAECKHQIAELNARLRHLVLAAQQAGECREMAVILDKLSVK